MTSYDISSDIEAVIQDGRNKSALTCVSCPSRILNAAVGFYVQKEFALPAVTRKKDQTEDEKHTFKDYWKVSDMFQFENVGFSNSVSGIKYLICADCEMGPIGWHDPQTKESYLALSRVRNS